MTELDSREKALEYCGGIPQCIDVRELKRLLREQGSRTIVVDVRSKEEVEVGHIPGAILPSELEERLSSSSSATGGPDLRDSTLVFYCTVGFRSAVWVKEYLAKGYNAVNLKGSILAWTNEPDTQLVDTAGQFTSKVHVYSEKFSFAGPRFTPVTFSSSKALMAGIGGLAGPIMRQTTRKVQQFFGFK